MIRKTTRIKNKTGLHARPASDFVKMASKFQSNITICRTGEEDDDANAKSIISILSLGLCMGEEVEIVAKGQDEEEAVNSLIALIDSGFGE
jgi:phosphocarrier protein HPr